MITALLFAAQLSLPQSMVPPPGEIRCTEDFVICWQRYADAAEWVVERKALEVQVEAMYDEILALREKLDRERAALEEERAKKTVTCASVKRVDKPKR